MDEFGRWTFISEAGHSGKGPPSATLQWRVRCSCGTVKNVNARTIRRGQSTSCGCRMRELQAAHLTSHGMSRTPEYRTWIHMRRRCQPQFRQSKDYADRGIVVCERWRDSFENFFADMGPRPGPDHTLERLNNDGIYEPSNCAWATRLAQQKNRRDVRLYQYAGQRLCAAEIARKTGIPYRTLVRHLLASKDKPEATISRLLARR